MNSKLELGTYKHYKGGMVTVIGVAKHSEDYTQELVIYTHPDEQGNAQMWARPLDMFLGNVNTPEYSGPRFEYIGE